MTKLSDRIKKLRTNKGLTQEEFGKLFGIVKSTVSLYEGGKSTPDDEVKKQIAKYFGVSLDYLMGVVDNSTPYENISQNINSDIANDCKTTFNERLKSLRKQSNKTQIEVAEVLGISRTAYNNYESGIREPDNDKIVKLANLFGVTTDYILGYGEHITTSNDIESGLDIIEDNDNTINVFGIRIRECRKKKGYTQNDLGKIIDLNRSNIANYEINKSKPSYEKLIEIADALEVSIDYLVGRTENPYFIKYVNFETNKQNNTGYIFNDILKKLRLNSGLTQENIANKLGVSRVAYTKYENGQNMPTPDKLENLANIFNISVDYLIGRTNNPTSYHLNEETSIIHNQPLELTNEEFQKLVFAKLDSIEKYQNEIKRLLQENIE